MKLSSKTALIALCLPVGAVCQTPGTVPNTPAVVAADLPILPHIPGWPKPGTSPHMAVADTAFSLSTTKPVDKEAAAAFLAQLTEFAK
ncbi:MAG TPA: hypothetical protein VKX25_03500 [Bryobacteraceae bacterium]|jgi:hypothetical protein|nr:hypothetical protein [Bryobacteraceae bacterium]